MGRRKGDPKTGGRAKGTPNKTTATVKIALQDAFNHLGGVSSLVKWAKEEPTEFYKLWAKLLPEQLNHSFPDGLPIMRRAIPRDTPGEYRNPNRSDTKPRRIR